MLRSMLEALVVGVVQGLTEFIPVSSSAHLVLVPYFLGFEEHGLAFDVALHMGTLGAVLVFFRAELAAMARGLLGMDRSPDALVYRRLGLLIVAASVPVAIVGLLAEGFVARVSASPVTAASLLFVTAGLLFVGERLRDRRARTELPATGPPEPIQEAAAQPDRRRLPLGHDPSDPRGRGLDRVGLREATVVGLAQCLALLPGVSRSGTTIVAGLTAGLTREAATRFSFLLALPALVGAGALSADELLATDASFSALELTVGVVSAFVSGYLAIRFLVTLVARDRLTGFALYCVVAAAAGLLGFAILGPR